MGEGSWIHRSGLFIIASQLEGACAALRIAVGNGLQPGPGTLTVLRKLRDDFASLSTGRSLQGLPEIDPKLSPVDVLVLAETLRMTVMSFLSHDELMEQKQAFGFTPATPPQREHPPSPSTRPSEISPAGSGGQRQS